MQIELPDSLVTQATAAGFPSVEAYVQFLIARDAAKSFEEGEAEDEGDDFVPLPLEEWNRRFEEMLAAAKPCNPNVDDSRESMYPVR